MKHLFHSHHPLRIFAVSALLTVAGLVYVLFGFGAAALLTAAILIVIEVVFSFDNAIVNAKVLERLSPFWMNMFLTVGMIIAVFGMRLLFPLVIVALAAGLSLGDVWTMALNDPHHYASILQDAHPLIASFGGAFLLLLALEFFINGEHSALWWRGLERQLKKLRSGWLPTVLAVVAVVALALVNSDHRQQIMEAGLLGIATYVVVQLSTKLLSRGQPKGKHLTGWAAFSLFMYLQVLDASFSFDGVIGAFAITDVVILIAVGLGIGAFWVRSLTIYLVRKGTLNHYKYLEHGAYYTILVLAASLLFSLFIEVPDAITGVLGVLIIGGAITASVRANNSNSNAA